MKDLAPLLLTYCIDFLRERPVGTRYHPKTNEFYLDGKTMARIIRHGGNLRAQTNSSETRFFTEIIYELSLFGRVDSPIHKESFDVKTNSDFQRKAIIVHKVKVFDSLRGRKPIGIGDPQNVAVSDD